MQLGVGGVDSLVLCMVLKTVPISDSAAWLLLVAHIAMCLSMREGRGIIPATLTDCGPSTGGGSAPLTSCPTKPFVAWIAATVKENQIYLEEDMKPRGKGKTL